MKFSFRIWQNSSILLFSIIIYGCANNNLSTTVTSPPKPTKTQLSTPTTTSTATPVILSDVDKYTPVANPLRFTLPTPGAVPISSWRPPLYPIPWALSEFDHFFFTRPVAADEINWPLPYYRYGKVEIGEDQPHTGIDISSPSGTPVLATGSGTIVWAGYGLYFGYEEPNDPYGLAIAIEHDFGYDGQPLYTAYAHLSKINFQRGERVEIGQIIGLSGATGNITGPHLHFEVSLGSNDYFHSLNPELWTSPPQGSGVLVGRIMSTGGLMFPAQEIRITSLESGRIWYAESYGTTQVIKQDPNYRENFVLGSIPSGQYEIFIPYEGYNYRFGIEIYPGAISFFVFRGHYGFFTDKPIGILPSNIPE